ncbi:MAG: MerR family transcriptional regulator [bacterium]
MQGPNIKRLYYSTVEISKMVNVRPYLIRKWESKFTFLNSVKKQSGRKLFKPDDLEIVKEIKRLKEIGYTDEKINEIMNNEDTSIEEVTVKPTYTNRIKPFLEEIYRELQTILEILNNHTL